MQPFGFLVEAAGRSKIGQLELAAGVLDPLPKDVKPTAPLNLRREAFQELVPYRGAVMLREPFPLLRLCSQDEVHHVAR